MTLKAQLLSDIDTVFLNTDEFAEGAAFWPLGVEADAISITVVIHENKLDIEQGQAEETAMRLLKVACKKSALTGVDLDDDNLGHALVLDSEPAHVWDFVRVADDYNGMLDIEFQRANLKTLRPSKLNSR